KLFDSLERDINKAYEHFLKWMSSWVHLPLSICRLGGNSGHEFARTFYNVVLQLPWPSEPTEREIEFAQQLRDDFKISNNTFGLLEELLDSLEFMDEFQ
ncbi:13806_t:CDS:1, partial [Ambispora leptoticha]